MYQSLCLSPRGVCPLKHRDNCLQVEVGFCLRFIYGSEKPACAVHNHVRRTPKPQIPTTSQRLLNM